MFCVSRLDYIILSACNAVCNADYIIPGMATKLWLKDIVVQHPEVQKKCFILGNLMLFLFIFCWTVLFKPIFVLHFKTLLCVHFGIKTHFDLFPHFEYFSGDLFTFVFRPFSMQRWSLYVFFFTCPILTNSACRASSFLRADLGDSGSTSLKDRRFNMFWGEKGT